MSEHDNPSSSTESGPPPSAAAHTTRRGGGGTVVLSVVLSVLFSGVAVLSAPYWSPWVSKVTRIADPLRRTEQETARLARGATETDAKVASLAERVASLAGSLQSSAEASQTLRSAAVALAAADLRTALRRTGPFDIELATLRAVSVGDAEVEKAIADLAGIASSGAPSRAQLRSEFPHAAAAAVNAATPLPEAREADAWLGPVSSAFTQFRYLVHLETPPADSPYAVAQRARTKLSDEDLAGAAEDLSRLPDPLPPATADWVAQAKARVIADHAAAVLTTIALSRAGSKG